MYKALRCPKCDNKQTIIQTLNSTEAECNKCKHKDVIQKFRIGYGFTPAHLQKLKATVRAGFESDYRITKAIYNGIGGTDKDLYINHRMLSEVTGEEIKSAVGEPIQLPTQSDSSVKLIGERLMWRADTKPIHRTDYVKFLNVWHSWYEPLAYESIPFEQWTRTETKARLTKMMSPLGRNEYDFHIECKLMDLFKKGTLSMEEVIEMSIEDCHI